MNRIKKVFLEMIQSIKEVIMQFPITTILIFIITTVISLLVVGEKYSENVSHIVFIGITWVMGIWLTEILFSEKKNVKKYIGILLSFCIALFIDRAIALELFNDELMLRWTTGYYLICFLSSIYLITKKQKIEFEKYSLSVMLNLKRTIIVWGIISLGICFLYSIFKILILENLKYVYLGKFIVLFTGFYLIPMYIKSLTDLNAEDTKFNKLIFSKVLLTLLIIAIAIVYIYIIKLIFITGLPSNEIFSICSIIFVFALPIHIINKNYNENDEVKLRVNLVNAIPYLYIPFVFLQMYSMGIRIAQYGLTESRYMACILIIFEICILFFSILKKGKYMKEIILVAILLSVIVTMSPLNYEDLPKINQRNIVEDYIENGVEFDNLSNELKKKYAGAYQYIEYEEKYNNLDLTDIEKDKLSFYDVGSSLNYTTSIEDEEAEESIYLSKKLEEIDISNYSKMIAVRSGFLYVTDASSLTLKNSDYVEIKTIDIEEYIKELINANEITSITAKRIFEENYEIVKIDENTDMYVTNVNIVYNKKTLEYTTISLDGYLLVK